MSDVIPVSFTKELLKTSPKMSLSEEEDVPEFIKIQQRNIAERNAAYKRLFEPVQDEASPAAKDSGTEKKTATSKKPPKKKAKRQPEADVDEDYVASVKQPPTPTQTRQLRPRSKAKTYVEDEELRADHYMFCDECQLEYVGSCPTHPFQKWHDVSKVLEVRLSKLQGAGRGVFNVSGRAIPTGVLFGPYTGTYVAKKDYKVESGYGWEIRDGDKDKPVGVIDPGVNPDPNVHILAMVNSANRLTQQNIVAVQYEGQIWYRVCKDIPAGAELLTYYGDDYSKTLGIFDTFKKEGVAAAAAAKKNGDNKVGAFPCVKCGFCWVTKIGLDYHRCRGDKKEMPQAEKLFKCDLCDKSYGEMRHLKRHKETAHLKIRYPCDTCGKEFSFRHDMIKHEKTVHSEDYRLKCNKCDITFTEKGNLKTRIRTVHEGQQPYSCTLCNKAFGHKPHLRGHIQTVHEKLRPYKCPHCSQAFGHKPHVKVHIKSVHSKEE